LTGAQSVGGASFLPIAWVTYHVDTLFTNNVLSTLFEKSADAEAYQGSVDCQQDCACSTFSILPFPEGETNEGESMGELVAGSLDAATSGFTLESKPGSYAFVSGHYVRFETPETTGDCFNMSIELTGWTMQASGLSAQISGICGGGLQNFEYSDQASLNSALSSICIAGGCSYIVIRGGASQVFTAEVTVLGTDCP
jgi:hypothetical protein